MKGPAQRVGDACFYVNERHGPGPDSAGEVARYPFPSLLAGVPGGSAFLGEAVTCAGFQEVTPAVVLSRL